MTLLAWIVVGLAFGFLARKAADRNGGALTLSVVPVGDANAQPFAKRVDQSQLSSAQRPLRGLRLPGE